MKIIFLDIDGCLNCFYGEEKATWEEEHTFDPECMKNLLALVSLTNAKIVISSTWRLHKDRNSPLWEILIKQFDEVGLEVYDVTPRSFQVQTFKMGPGQKNWSYRGDEIQKWLDDHQEVTKFVILDDDSDMCHLLPYLVKTCSYHGFVDEFLQPAIDILNGE